MTPPLVTPRFLTMFGFSFLVFTSVFQLLPVAPYRMIALGGTPASAGWFLGLLTISCAVSAPFTGPLCDRVGHRRSLIIAGASLSVITAVYSVVQDNKVLLALVVLHGVVWSALMAASSAYATATIPPARRAEGLGYWGMASIVAIGVAPTLGFWVYQSGWHVLCLELAALNVLMTCVGWALPDERMAAAEVGAPLAEEPRRFGIEWRVIVLAVTLSCISYGYGGLTSFSALFADAIGVNPRSTFLSAMAVSVIASRLFIGRRMDTWGAGAEGQAGAPRSVRSSRPSTRASASARRPPGGWCGRTGSGRRSRWRRAWRRSRSRTSSPRDDDCTSESRCIERRTTNAECRTNAERRTSRRPQRASGGSMTAWIAGVARLSSVTMTTPVSTVLGTVLPCRCSTSVFTLW